MYITVNPVMAQDAVVTNSSLGRLLITIEEAVLRPAFADLGVTIENGIVWQFDHSSPRVWVSEDEGDLDVDGDVFDALVNNVTTGLLAILKRDESVRSFGGQIYLEGFNYNLALSRPEPEPEVVTLRTTPENLERAREILRNVLGLEDGFEIVRGTE